MLALYLRARNRFAELARREEGQGLTEYALIIALVAVALVGALIAFRGEISGVFESIGDAFSG
jgi:pilus assembly protein Flp/PilA